MAAKKILKRKTGGAALPKASRPHMPEYGILPAAKGRGLLPWSWAQERLRKGHTYWVATTRPGGRPHAMPVWGVWLDDRFYFSTGRRSRKARNLAANPHCVIGVERARESVIVEGIAAEISDPALFRRAGQPYRAKYKSDLDPDLGPIYAVRPRVAFGFIEKAEEFVKTATRWKFGDGKL